MPIPTVPTMLLFTVQLSRIDVYYNPAVPSTTLLEINVFAPDRDEAIRIALAALTQPERYCVDDVDEY